jgi:single-stranded DNA-specific DHH superfamily exonuclease
MGNNRVDEYFEALKKGIAALKSYESKELFLLHHNDSDGLTSGAILYSAFKREGYDVEKFSLEKPYPDVLKKLFDENSGKIIVFADFAGKIAPMLSELNRGRNLVFVLDHHRAEPVIGDDTVLNLDPDLYGLKGDRDISASVVCYLFAKELNSLNEDLVHIAAFGGIADFYYLDEDVHSFNRECLEDACAMGLMRIEYKEGKERFIIRLGEKEVDVVEFYPLLDTLGGVGFYDKGPEKGIDLLLNGLTDSCIEEINNLTLVKEKIFSAEISRIKDKEYNEIEDIIWFDVKDRFAPMGVKMIGVFCEEIVEATYINQNKYLAGFQRIPDTVPGFGKLEMGQTKVSMRTSNLLSKKIMDKKIPGLNDFLPEATLNLGGFADACHSIAAATTIDVGMEEKLMNETQKTLNIKK